MRKMDQIAERLGYVGNQAETDIQWLLSQLEKAERVMTKALSYLSDTEIVEEIKKFLVSLSK
ncbi:hypothetical protein [Cohnella soli]|uniref:Spo0E family sporulation regulatory protein-aspartic acid phosphatase n=1 Tax=Cohnella soli TaxID=425005 RepID=A0ABW0HJV4_9BACL